MTDTISPSTSSLATNDTFSPFPSTSTATGISSNQRHHPQNPHQTQSTATQSAFSIVEETEALRPPTPDIRRIELYLSDLCDGLRILLIEGTHLRAGTFFFGRPVSRCFFSIHLNHQLKVAYSLMGIVLRHFIPSSCGASSTSALARTRAYMRRSPYHWTSRCHVRRSLDPGRSRMFIRLLFHTLLKPFLQNALFGKRSVVRTLESRVLHLPKLWPFYSLRVACRIRMIIVKDSMVDCSKNISRPVSDCLSTHPD